MSAASSPKLFISYRREETAGHAGRLYDAIAARFGDDNVFMDVELAPGLDFVEQIQAAVDDCRALLVVMGPRWASAASPGEAGTPRLAKPGDYVRLEVETALRRADVRVIPVLVAGARMPEPEQLPESLRSLARRNAIELSDGRWRFDVGRLVDALDDAVPDADTPTEMLAAVGRPLPDERAPSPSPAPAPAAPARARALAPLRLIGEGALVAALVGLVGYLLAIDIDDSVDFGTSSVKVVADNHIPVAFALRVWMTWIPVALALALWIALRVRGGRVRVAPLAAAVAFPLLAGAAVGALLRDNPPVTLGRQLLALALVGLSLGAVAGSAWQPRRVALAAAAGAAAGALFQLLLWPLLGAFTLVQHGEWPFALLVTTAAIAAASLAALLWRDGRLSDLLR